ncbi:MAG: hypothetical protein ACYCQJ_13885 [Nitrososphaerales archaeon]
MTINDGQEGGYLYIHLTIDQLVSIIEETIPVGKYLLSEEITFREDLPVTVRFDLELTKDQLDLRTPLYFNTNSLVDCHPGSSGLICRS